RPRLPGLPRRASAACHAHFLRPQRGVPQKTSSQSPYAPVWEGTERLPVEALHDPGSKRVTMIAIRTNKTAWAVAAGVLLVFVAARPVRGGDESLYHQTLKSTGWIITPGALQGTCWVVDQERQLVVTSRPVVGAQ